MSGSWWVNGTAGIESPRLRQLFPHLGADCFKLGYEFLNGKTSSFTSDSLEDPSRQASDELLVSRVGQAIISGGIFFQRRAG